MNTTVDTLVKRFEGIKSARGNFDSHWQECADYCLPQKATITSVSTPGTKLNTLIYDSTAIQSVQIFAAGLHSYLTNPSARWFALGMRDKKLNDSQEIKNWLKEVEECIFDYLNNSNFNEVIDEDYIDFGVFGNSTLYEEEDAEDLITFFARPVQEVFFLANHRGRIDTIYRHFTFTVRQAMQRWGENAGKKVKDLYEAGKVEEALPFLHIVLPREERDVRLRDARNMPHASIYIEPETKKILSEGGYEEFPFFVGRCYKTSMSEYAYSPASIALADIKMLNTMSRDILEAAQKTLHPPVILPNDGYLLPFRTSPKAQNYKLSTNPDDKIEVLQMNREIGLSLEMENQRRASIQKAFFVDLFLMLAGLPDKQRTATEIAERVNERMLILGPMLGRLMHGKLDPIIHRTFAILERNGKLPPKPESIINKDYKVNYISPLAKAQKAAEMKSYNELIIATQAMMQVNPYAADNINSDKILKRIADINYVGDVLHSDDDIKAVREQRNQQQQMAQQLEMMKTGGEGAKAVVEAEQILKGGEGGKTKPK